MLHYRSTSLELIVHSLVAVCPSLLTGVSSGVDTQSRKNTPDTSSISVATAACMEVCAPSQDVLNSAESSTLTNGCTSGKYLENTAHEKIGKTRKMELRTHTYKYSSIIITRTGNSYMHITNVTLPEQVLADVVESVYPVLFAPFQERGH